MKWQASESKTKYTGQYQTKVLLLQLLSRLSCTSGAGRVQKLQQALVCTSAIEHHHTSQLPSTIPNTTTAHHQHVLHLEHHQLKEITSLRNTCTFDH